MFVTFSTFRRWLLPPAARDAVMASCIHDHGMRYVLHAAVVMPDHVHVLLTPQRDASGGTFGLAEIMSGLKGSSAHAVNAALRRRGRVWEPESWDSMVRSSESLRSKATYICDNPVRAGLADDASSYPWIWREWIEGQH